MIQSKAVIIDLVRQMYIGWLKSVPILSISVLHRVYLLLENTEVRLTIDLLEESKFLEPFTQEGKQGSSFSLEPIVLSVGR